MKLYGFSLLKNGVKYDYSFRESLLSLGGITDEVYLALGQSEDSTAEEVRQLEKIKIIPTIWDPNLKQGLVLSDETNKALSVLRNDHSGEGAWAIYLQADEVLHEEDYKQILSDIQEAEQSGCDALAFSYLHFWLTHHDLATSKRWYPHEIRAIKLDSKIESWGDAQGFRNYSKVYYTKARIFHYGHVRDQNVYKKKMEEMSSLYHSDPTQSKYYNAKDRDKENDHECVAYFGTHPKWMKERILRMGDIWELEERDLVYILGDKKEVDENLLRHLKAKKIEFVSSRFAIQDKSAPVISMQNSWWHKMGFAKVPFKMKSKHAHKWDDQFRFILLASSLKVGFRHQD